MKHDWIPRHQIDVMPGPLAEYLSSRVKRLGYLGEMFQVGANVPAVLLDFMHLTDSLKKAIAFDIGETVVLSVASLMRNRYERHQHERLCLRNGLTTEWISDVQALAPEAATRMTAPQRAAQRYAIALVRTQGHDVANEFDALSAHFRPDEAVAIAFLVGRYITHALLVNTLEMEPPVPSIFEDGFTV